MCDVNVSLRSHFARMNLDARDRLKAALQPLIEKQGLRSYARSIRLSPATISKWMNGDTFPDGNNRDRVAASLRMTLDRFDQEIVQGKEPQATDPIEQTLRWLNTASRSDLATILHAVADKLIH